MNSVPQRRSRTSLVFMIVGGLLMIAPVFGPLRSTLRYLDDFFAEWSQSMSGPDTSFYIELLALLVCPVALLIFTIALFLLSEVGGGSEIGGRMKGNHPWSC
jgi:hypothetical protein